MTTAYNGFDINFKSLIVTSFPNMITKAILKLRLRFETSKCAPPTAISFMQFIYISQEEHREA
jgi:hypothetical protein